MEKSIVPAHLAVKSMRDNGYRNTAYAIAELIDNSIQHGSKMVKLICLEEETHLNKRTVSRIKQIAVLDNGNGMDKETLWKALQFGNGTNLAPESQDSIGKFGMGLPSSSISQAKTLEVWTWNQKEETLLYSYLDVDEIIDRTMNSVPEPVSKEIPEDWKKIIGKISETGTLVVWSNLDRCLWRTAKSVVKHSKLLVGRLYRKFIHKNEVEIRVLGFKKESLKKATFDEKILANDPLYLMEKTCVSGILKNMELPDPMFFEHGKKVYKIKYKEEEHIVNVRYSVAKEEARKWRSSGAKPHGKHASNNIGVSIIRAGRELDLDTTWVIGYDARERWWGIEIEFPPSLDEVFGVTNNKQFANNFKELGNLDINQFLEENGLSLPEYKEELRKENDPKALLMEIAGDIKNQLRTIRKNIKKQADRLEKDDTKRHSDNEAEQHATEKTEGRKESGHKGESDRQEEQSDEQNQDELTDEFKEDDIPDPEGFAKMLISSDIKYQFILADLESHAFFTCKSRGSKIIIKLNVGHPAHGQFVELLNELSEEETKEDLFGRLKNARDGMKLILMAWARFEDEALDEEKKKIRDIRMDWGRMIRDFMDEE